jgi:Predicted DNA alkylation repair enzyme
MAENNIIKKLTELGEPKYADFSAKLTPTVDRGRVLGVRIPELRKFAKSVYGTPEAEAFLNTLPHYYFDENNLHGALLSLEKRDIAKLLERTEKFLPHIDNWATCDLFSPKLFAKYPELVYDHIDRWLDSPQTYTQRFAITTLLGFYLKENYAPEHSDRLAALQSGEYYVNMALAWYFAEGLALHPEEFLPYFGREKIANPWVRAKAAQKARESRRVSADILEKLKTL